MKTAIVIAGMALMIATSTRAQNLDTNLSVTLAEPPLPRYHSQEFSFDAFGGVAVDQQTVDANSRVRTRHEARLGTGIGANYFFTRYIGVAAEGFTENPRHSFVDNTDGSMVFRLPFGDSGMAAYIFGGAGRQFDPIAGTTFHTGGGLEYRFSRHVGAFLEPRLVIKQGNYGFGRCGVRCNF